MGRNGSTFSKEKEGKGGESSKSKSLADTGEHEHEMRGSPRSILLREKRRMEERHPLTKHI